MAVHAAATEYLGRVPTDRETAEAAVAPYRRASVAERFAAFTALQQAMDALLGDRLPLRGPDDAAFWQHWVDPQRGRPR